MSFFNLTVNPDTDNGSLALSKNIAYSVTAGPDGKTLMFENSTALPMVNFSGNVYTEDQITLIETEIAKDLSTFSDDRGVELDVIWLSCEFERVRSNKHPWKHRYTITGKVIDYTLP